MSKETKPPTVAEVVRKTGKLIEQLTNAPDKQKALDALVLLYGARPTP